MVFLDFFQLVHVLFVVHISIPLLCLTLRFFLSHLTDTILPILKITAEHALVKEAALTVFQRESVHSGTPVPMESLRAVAALDSSTLCTAPKAGELFFVD